jgi:DNA-binding response OmpR family regulator
VEKKPTILLAGDEQSTIEEMTQVLAWAGFRVVGESEGGAVLAHILSAAPDLVVLDVQMPRLDGREVLSHLRGSGNWVPVILLGSGKAAERILALNEGADDYLSRPFDPNELVARIGAVLRRVRVGALPLESANRLSSHDLVIDRLSRRAWFASQELILTPKAFALLEYLMTHPDQLLSRDMLLDAVWGWDYPAGIRAVDTRIFELRRALGDRRSQPRFIETVSGQGYRFIGVVEAIP